MNIGRQLARTAFELEKHSPTILFGAGIVGVVGSTVLACRATLKMEDVLHKTETEIKKAKTLEHREYSDEDRQKDIRIIYVRLGLDVAKLYAPAVILGSVSIGALVRSHTILSRRNAALGAAYAALDKGFKQYRARVVEKYGEEEDRNFRYGSQQVEVLDDETGKKKTVTRVSDDIPSIYARFFDQTCKSWSKEPEYNLLFLNGQQNYVNDLLKSRGHVFLNEVYDLLGFPRSKAGSVVGWIMTGNAVDNFIDFGVWRGESQVARDFVNGKEGAILLDFNVDGVIYDKIDTPTEALSWQMGN